MRRTHLPFATASVVMTVVVMTVVVMAVAACGSGTRGAAPSSVRSTLSHVDAAVRAHDYGGARTDVEALVAQTIAARDHAQMSASQAKDILAAAAQLLADLPQPAPDPSPTAQPTKSDPGNGEGPGNGGGSGNDGGKKSGGGDNGHGRKGPNPGHG